MKEIKCKCGSTSFKVNYPAAEVVNTAQDISPNEMIYATQGTGGIEVFCNSCNKVITGKKKEEIIELWSNLK